MPAHLSYRTVAIVGITLLALVFGGSTELWAQAIIVLLGSLLILIFPPRLQLGWTPSLTLLLFLCLALSAFLPAAWGEMPDWRHHLLDMQAPLGDFRTPQPWITLQSCGLLFFCLVWIYYLLAQEWSPAEKSQALRLFTSGIILLATVSIAAYLTNYRIPGWNQEQNRGWFPNRNQTADVLALGGIINYAIAFRSFGKREWSAVLWLVGLVLIGSALVISYSRAGIILFFVGVFVWHVAGIFSTRENKTIAFGLAALFMLMSLFLLFGGSTLERFEHAPKHGKRALHAHVENTVEDYRTLIQEDAIRVSLQAPFLGTGLGNFEPIFTSMRTYSADQNRALHPESDWLWMVVEMGWLSSVLIIVGLGWWFRECLPFVIKSGEALRRTAMVAFVMFLVHGFVDVSGHRLGSFLVAILMASLALSPTRKRVFQTWITYFFRGLAVLLGLLGTWWIVSVCSDMGPPTTATIERLNNRMNLDAAQGRVATMGESAEAGLALAPLNWSYYFRRATAEAFRTGGTDKADNDFQVARFLQPNWTDLCLNEGEVWLATNDSDRCLEAWREALRRARSQGVSVYASMLALSLKNPDVHGGLREFATTNLGYLITFLDYATPEEENADINELLTHDPGLQSLSFDEQKRLFNAWWMHGDQSELARQLLSHADWQQAGWMYLALHFASQQDFQQACAIALRYLPPPVLQPVPPGQSLAVLQSNFSQHPDDCVEGVTLCQVQDQHNKTDDALDTIARLQKLKNCPSYVFYLQAQLEMKKGAWDKAWDALQQYGALPGSRP